MVTEEDKFDGDGSELANPEETQSTEPGLSDEIRAWAESPLPVHWLRRWAFWAWFSSFAIAIGIFVWTYNVQYLPTKVPIVSVKFGSEPPTDDPWTAAVTVENLGQSRVKDIEARCGPGHIIMLWQKDFDISFRELDLVKDLPIFPSGQYKELLPGKQWSPRCVYGVFDGDSSKHIGIDMDVTVAYTGSNGQRYTELKKVHGEGDEIGNFFWRIDDSDIKSVPVDP